MKKTVSHRISASFLAILMLVCTNSFAIERHFCGEFLVDTAVFSEPEKCMANEHHCDDDVENAAVTSNCCEDTVDLVEGQEVLTTNKFDDLDDQQQLFLVAFGTAYFNIFQSFSAEKIPHQYYSPPLLVKDAQLQYQVFLI